jgi:hypothetical protein
MNVPSTRDLRCEISNAQSISILSEKIILGVFAILGFSHSLGH